MRIATIETSVVSLPFAMGGPHPLFAGFITAAVKQSRLV